MNDGLKLLLLGAASVAVFMLLLWLIHLRTGNAAIVDAGWAGGLALLGLLYAALGHGYWVRSALIGTMSAIWGIRLAIYLLATRIIGHPEEGRYQELRRQWKTNIPFKFLWAMAMVGEAAADAQLSKFKSDPSNKGRTCQVGLWRYSRHPNYFFEWLIWIAFALFALASPGGFWGLLSPALILYFVLRVTGIPATEAQAIRTRGEEYRRYQRTTSAFVPWFPKTIPQEKT